LAGVGVPIDAFFHDQPKPAGELGVGHERTRQL